MRPELRARQDAWGWRIELVDEGNANVILSPLALHTSQSVLAGAWSNVVEQSNGLSAEGEVSDSGVKLHFTLAARIEENDGPVLLHWTVTVVSGTVEGALVHAIELPGISLTPDHVTLPSIHYGHNTYGRGMFPRPDPLHGFSFRADRMGQPAMLCETPLGALAYFAADEAPAKPEPYSVYSLGIETVTGGSRLFFRYPQLEYGHRGDGSPEAYIAKSTFAPGENVFRAWAEGDMLEKTLYLWQLPSRSSLDYAAPARYLWQRRYPIASTTAASSLLEQAGERIRWYNERLYNPSLGGGQYESPEGSGTAMLGFVEQSLCMAGTTLLYADICLSSASPTLPADTLHRLHQRGQDALTRWSTEGRSPEGLLFPACDAQGYSFGYRDYSDYEGLTIVKDESFDVIREASEARMLLSASQSALISRSVDAARVDLWGQAVTGVADWLLAHPLPSGGYSSRYRRSGEPLDEYAGGTSAAISLFADTYRFLQKHGRREAQGYIEAAVAAYEAVMVVLLRAGLFAGGTLDASAPDREAAISALDACISLFEATGDEQYLVDARYAADNILSYTLVYPITTFAPGSDAARLGVSTFGATIVSPENQHLDAVATAPSMLVYGIYADDKVCVQAAIESLKFVLDGRWGMREADGVKQSEQLLHTRWYYNEFFTRRGDFRRGMPLWGRTDSEHGWPQVVPASCLLGCGQVMVDWASGRGVGVDGWVVESCGNDGRGTLIAELTPVGTSGSEPKQLLLRVLRLPQSEHVKVVIAGRDAKYSSMHLGRGCMLDAHAGPVKVEISVMGSEEPVSAA